MSIILGEEQVKAIESIKTFVSSSETCISLSGYAGTGKSTIVLQIIEMLEKKNKPYILCAPTHKAKVVLETFTGREGCTIHKLLSLSPNIEIQDLDFRELTFQMRNKVNLIPSGGIVICDESSMINDELYEALKKETKALNSQIIFVGDKAQIQPVNSRSYSKVFSLPNSITLTKIYRQSSESGLITTLEELRTRALGKFNENIGTDGSLYCYSDIREFFKKLIPLYKKAINNASILEVKLLAYTNARVDALNNKTKELLFGNNNEYNKGEFITGTENLSFGDVKFWNSMDYIIADEPEKIDLNIKDFISLPSYRLNLYNSSNHSLESVCILSKEISSDYLNSLAYFIEDLRLSALNTKYGKGKVWAKYYKLMESFTTPVDLFYDGRMIRKKSFSLGYASTIHRSQGSTLNNVFIDSKDLGVCRNVEELRQLQYVALSRAKNNVYIYQ